jgi:hypothetical protein
MRMIGKTLEEKNNSLGISSFVTLEFIQTIDVSHSSWLNCLSSKNILRHSNFDYSFTVKAAMLNIING